MEYGETPRGTAIREVKVETGLDIDAYISYPLAAVNNIYWEEGKQYVTLFMRMRLEDPGQTPVNLEPHKCREWMWLGVDELLGLPLLPCLRDLIEKRPEAMKRILEG